MFVATAGDDVALRSRFKAAPLVALPAPALAFVCICEALQAESKMLQATPHQAAYTVLPSLKSFVADLPALNDPKQLLSWSVCSTVTSLGTADL